MNLCFINFNYQIELVITNWIELKLDIKSCKISKKLTKIFLKFFWIFTIFLIILSNSNPILILRIYEQNGILKNQ